MTLVDKSFCGRDVPTVVRAEFSRTGFTESHMRGVRFVGWRTTATLVTHVARLIDAGEPFVYAYYDGVDKVAHEYGITDGFFPAEMCSTDHLVGDLLDALPGRRRPGDHRRPRPGPVRAVGDDGAGLPSRAGLRRRRPPAVPLRPSRRRARPPQGGRRRLRRRRLGLRSRPVRRRGLARARAAPRRRDLPHRRRRPWPPRATSPSPTPPIPTRPGSGPGTAASAPTRCLSPSWPAAAGVS